MPIKLEKREEEPKNVINGIVINKEKKVLLVQKKKTLILPGGNRELGESKEDCLSREIKEELNSEIEIKESFCQVEGISPHRKNKIKAEAFFVTLLEEPTPKAEISNIRWVKGSEIDELPISKITLKILEKLKEKNKI